MFRFLIPQRDALAGTTRQDDILAGLGASERLSHLALLAF